MKWKRCKIRNLNPKRFAFILASMLLVWANLGLDVYFMYSLGERNVWAILIFMVQPCLYYVYYQISYTLTVIWGEFHTSCRSALIVYLLQAPVYVVTAEVKLMMSSLYKLAQPINHRTVGDRIRHDFMSHMVVHGFFHSLPMALLQFSLLKDLPLEFLAFPCFNLFIAVYGCFMLYLILAFTNSRHRWLQEPKSIIQNYISNPGLSGRLIEKSTLVLN